MRQISSFSTPPFDKEELEEIIIFLCESSFVFIDVGVYTDSLALFIILANSEKKNCLEEDE
jgi:hypothetical protein